MPAMTSAMADVSVLGVGSRSWARMTPSSSTTPAATFVPPTSTPTVRPMTPSFVRSDCPAVPRSRSHELAQPATLAPRFSPQRPARAQKSAARTYIPAIRSRPIPNDPRIIIRAFEPLLVNLDSFARVSSTGGKNGAPQWGQLDSSSGTLAPHPWQGQAGGGASGPRPAVAASVAAAPAVPAATGAASVAGAVVTVPAAVTATSIAGAPRAAGRVSVVTP